MPITQRIAPCLWFDHQAEEAAKFYVSVFKNSKITSVARYSEVGHEIHKQPAGSVMTVAFELDGQPFTALNGGPVLQVQRGGLAAGLLRHAAGDRLLLGQAVGGRRPASAQQCGWLKDKYGLSWQVVPKVLPELLKDHESPKRRSARWRRCFA